MSVHTNNSKEGDNNSTIEGSTDERSVDENNFAERIADIQEEIEAQDTQPIKKLTQKRKINLQSWKSNIQTLGGEM